MKLQKLASIMFVAFLFIIFTTSGWTQETKILDIGIAVPLTGPAANIGTNFKNTLLIIMDEVNAKGGLTIAGVKYKLNPIVRDDKFSPVEGRAVAEELVYDKKVKIIFGPSPVEGPSMVPVTNSNKVLLFGMAPVPDMAKPTLPYVFFVGGIPDEMYVPVCEYTRKFYPNAKRVLTLYAALPDAIPWMSAGERMLKRYGFTYLGYEQYPPDTNDFAPIVQKVLSHNPEVVDFCGNGGAMGAVCGLITRQLRQGGFNGVILMPAVPPPGIMDIVPKEYLTKIVTNDINIDSPIVTKTYRDLVNKYVRLYGSKPIDFAGAAYNGAHAFFTFLDGQKTMDTAAWIQDFRNYRWKGVYGNDARWVGKPMFGINNCLISNVWASEWKNGKLETNFVAKIPYELFESK